MSKMQSSKGLATSLLIVGSLIVVLLIVIIVFISPLSKIIFPEESAPTLALVVTEPPMLDEPTGKYRVVVEALVTGNPEPEVLFNRNDGLGAVERNSTVILLAEDESFMLSAIAANRAGEVRAALEINSGVTAGERTESILNDLHAEGVSGENQNSITTSRSSEGNEGNPNFALDENSDGVDQSGQGSNDVNDNEEGNDAHNQMEDSNDNLPDPAQQDNQSSRESGDDIEDGLEVYVYNTYKTLYAKPGESGSIINSSPPKVISHSVIIGDSAPDNNNIRGYISFDISALSRKTVESATLLLENPTIQGDPSFLHGGSRNWIVLSTPIQNPWGGRSLLPNDQNIRCKNITTFNSYNIDYESEIGKSSSLLADELQSCINREEVRFQLRIEGAVPGSDNDGEWDFVKYNFDNIKLKVYTK